MLLDFLSKQMDKNIPVVACVPSQGAMLLLCANAENQDFTFNDLFHKLAWRNYIYEESGRNPRKKHPFFWTFPKLPLPFMHGIWATFSLLKQCQNQFGSANPRQCEQCPQERVFFPVNDKLMWRFRSPPPSCQ